MANFGQLMLTNLGLQAQLKAQSGGELKFKRIAMGSGEFDGNVGTLTSLVVENVSIPVSNGQIQNNAYTVEGFFSNDALQLGFAWREVGVYVENSDGSEILYCYANAGDTYDFIPATTSERYSKYIRIAMAVGNAANVSIVENEVLIYVDSQTFKVTIGDLADLPTNDKSSLVNAFIELFNSNLSDDTKLDDIDGVLSVEKGGTGKNNAADGFTVLARRNTVGNSNLVNADTLTVPGIHQVYFEGNTYKPQDYNFPYAYGVLFVASTVSYVGQLFFAVSANKLWYRMRGTINSPWSDWRTVYDTINKPTLDELGAAAASKHNIKTYTNLSQLGLSNGATMSQVARALPGSSSLRIYVLTSENANLAPSATNGWLEVNRPATNHVEFRYTTTSRMVYYAVVLNVNNANEQVSVWTKVASEEDLSNYAPAFTYGTTDLTAGSSSLETGKQYLVYE